MIHWIFLSIENNSNNCNMDCICKDTDQAKISLVLDSRTAIRLYIEGVSVNTKFGSFTSKASTKTNKKTYPS